MAALDVLERWGSGGHHDLITSLQCTCYSYTVTAYILCTSLGMYLVVGLGE